ADPTLLAARDPYREALGYYATAPGGTLERMSHADLQTYLVELLMKQDQMSMAASIESRVPFLDHVLVEYATAIPGRLKLRGWRTKAVLRAALQDVVPPEVLTRRKMGFPVPVGRWLRNPFWPVVQEFVLGRRALRRGRFDAPARRNRITRLTTHGPADDPRGLAAALPRCEVVSVPWALAKRESARFVLSLLRSWLSSLPVDLYKARVPALRREVTQRLAAGGIDLVVADFLAAVPNVPADGVVPTVLFA